VGNDFQISESLRFGVFLNHILHQDEPNIMVINTLVQI